MKVGIDYNDLEENLGREVGPSAWVEVSQEMINLYADAVQDHNWIHVDVPRATNAFGGTVAHGLLTLSLAPPIAQDMIAVQGVESDLNYGFERVRFTSVVHAGDRVRLYLKILDVAPRGEGKLLRMQYRIELERTGEPAVIADWTFLLFPSAASMARMSATG